MWTVRLDFRVRYTGMHKLWIVGIVEQEALVIEVPKDHETPNMIQKGKTMRFKLQTPFLDTRSKIEQA